MRKLLAAGLVLLGMSSGSYAADGVEQVIADNLKAVNARLAVTSVAPAPVDGIYEVVLNNGDVIYADAKGEYFFAGSLLKFNVGGGLVNLTEQRFNAKRADKMRLVDEQELISYRPQGEVKAVVNIFTDVDCPYCRKLHAEVPKLTAMGVQINYLAFPRQGFGSATYNKMVSIWCAEPGQRQAAMDQVKAGKSIEPASCDSPVMQHYTLGQEVGVTGTPALVLEDGTLVPGYMPAERLAEMLKLN